MTKHVTAFAAATFAALAAAGTAQAGGLEANGYNWDQLFDAAPYSIKAQTSYVWIDQPIKNAAGQIVANSANRTYYNAGVKADFGDASCLVSIQNPWGAGTDRAPLYSKSTQQSFRERITSNDYGLTCSYGFAVGAGVLNVIGGLSAQTLDYKSDFIYPLDPLNRTQSININGQALGWRAGLAYEMPEIALRVSAIYNSANTYTLKGNIDGAIFNGAAAEARVTTPQSFEIKGQTGIAPGWLALASVKWTNWAVLDTLTVTNAVGNVSSRLNYEDGWTVMAGVGHQLTDDITVLGSLTWDKGTSKGGTAVEDGNQNDRWAVALGGAYKPSENVELTLGGSYSVIAGGSNSAKNENWNNGSVFALQAGLKVSF